MKRVAVECMHKNGVYIRFAGREYLTGLFVSLTASCAKVNDFIMETRGWIFQMNRDAHLRRGLHFKNQSASRVCRGFIKKSAISSPEIRDAAIMPKQTVNDTNDPVC